MYLLGILSVLSIAKLAICADAIKERPTLSAGSDEKNQIVVVLTSSPLLVASESIVEERDESIGRTTGSMKKDDIKLNIVKQVMRRSRRSNESGDFFQLFDDLLIAQNVGHKLVSSRDKHLAGSGNDAGEGSIRQPFRVQQSPNSKQPNANTQSISALNNNANSNDNDVSNRHSQRRYPSGNARFGANRLQTLAHALREWLSKQCSYVNAALAFVASSFVQEAIPQHKLSRLPVKERRLFGTSGDGSNSKMPNDFAKLTQAASAMLQSTNSSTLSLNASSSLVLYSNAKKRQRTNASLLNAPVKPSIVTTATSITEIERLQRVKRSQFVGASAALNSGVRKELQISPALGTPMAATNANLLQQQSLLAMQQQHQQQQQQQQQLLLLQQSNGNCPNLPAARARCQDLEAQVGQNLAHNLPTSQRQIQEICSSINALLKQCWPPAQRNQASFAGSAPSEFAQANLNQQQQQMQPQQPLAASQLSTAIFPTQFGTLGTQQESQKQLSNCDKLQQLPSLSENIQSRVYWVQNNMCTDSDFQKEFIDNLQCLSRWSKSHAERVCWKEYTLIQQKILQPNMASISRRQLLSDNSMASQSLTQQLPQRMGVPPKWDDEVDVEREFKTLCCRQAIGDCGKSASHFVVKFMSKIGSEDVRYLCNSRVVSNVALNSTLGMDNQLIDEVYCRDQTVFSSIESAMSANNFNTKKYNLDSSIKYPPSDGSIKSVLYGSDMIPGNGSRHKFTTVASSTLACYIVNVIVLLLMSASH